MQDGELLKKISDEYQLWYNYVLPLRTLYRERILRWSPQNKKDSKININMIANAIDVKIASSWSNGLKVKFISRNGWVGEEEAENLTNVAEFDEKETAWQQIRYQLEQDSWFFGVGILNKIGWDDVKICNKWRAVNPLSWIPDPLPTQTGQFDGQNYRFHGFMMRTTVYDLKARYDNNNVNDFFRSQYDSDQTLTKQAYSSKGWYWPVTCDTLTNNFSLDIYTHYTVIDNRKWKIVTDNAFWHIFYREELKAVTKEEKLDPMLIPRPVMLNYTDPVRENPLGNSICDKLEDKQNAKSILANLNIIKSKKEALGWDFLVNSRLIKNKDDLKKNTTETRYIYIDEDAIGNQPLQNAMFELPQSQIKTDTFNMMNFLDTEARNDAKIDQLQAWIAPDKTMTKAESQTIQGNANAIIRTTEAIKSWFYQEMYFQRWRGYLEHFKDWREKFVILNSNFERKGVTYTKDKFVGKQIPYIMVANADDINAINERQKQYLNVMNPQIQANPTIPQVSKDIFQRLVHKVNGLEQNIINIITPYSPSEQKAKEYINIINLEVMPKSLFSDPQADFFTYWLYIQKAEDNEIKNKVLWVLSQYLMENGMQQQMQQTQDNSMSNSAANIQMSQQPSQEWALSRSTPQPVLWQ